MKKTFSDMKVEIQKLQVKLNTINTEKENWFAKRNEYSQQIRAEIAKIKESTKNRNMLTYAVHEEKKKRDELNNVITEKMKEAKAVQKQQKGTEQIERKFTNPEELKRQIIGLEKKIETEGFSFDKEKQIMKTINTLRKQYEEAKKRAQEKGKVRDLTKDIWTLKKQANEKHYAVQETAKESQKQHETLIAESRKIVELRKAEKEAHQKFMELKKQFNDMNRQLRTAIGEIKEAKNVIEEQWHKKQKHAEEEKDKKLAEKVKTVEEKLKSGGKVKLTMEDLIVFQGMK